MLLRSAGVEIRWDEGIRGLRSLDEAQLLADLAEAGWNTEEAEDVVEDNMGAIGLTSLLDPGVAGLVIAISALGGTPISSCNGGLIGTSANMSDVPNILFTASPDTMDRIIQQAMGSEVGLVFNEGYAEAFVDHLPNFHRLARKLLDLPPLARTTSN
ncbi:hypothetical protein HPDFL43_17570 [Hoeflea phototrophica DFL-43]|jgi:hypothetical protein|uniref:Uncharacterized protein n=1 Tax=Hoeflea phototrophica (strain DSM 17068 / NCIMB 14078 / DFL-43) TaxID=411684 RepID=A9DFQ9_HOEPD|nr:hypothetical protein [Hoeflea phototrophica]EDQ31650.1 hypothetical protein HPDFL43_17570 [Hoeflea phototrophica DFL-43]